MGAVLTRSDPPSLGLKKKEKNQTSEGDGRQISRQLRSPSLPQIVLDSTQPPATAALDRLPRSETVKAMAI